jgi:MerR family transcriptional regulator/heat shock protein HspR
VSTLELIFISDAARMLDMHPQTLRKYERLGLVRPARTVGSMRLYSRGEIERLRFIKRLVDESGVNLAGVQQLLSVAEVMQRIRPLMRPSALQRDATRRQLIREMDQLAELLGIEIDAERR